MTKTLLERSGSLPSHNRPGPKALVPTADEIALAVAYVRQERTGTQVRGVISCTNPSQWVANTLFRAIRSGKWKIVPLACLLVLLASCGKNPMKPILQTNQTDIRYYWDVDHYRIARPGDSPVYRDNQWGTDLELDDATPSDPRMNPNNPAPERF